MKNDLRFGIPLTNLIIPLSSILLPLISTVIKKDILLAIKLHVRLDILLLRI